MRRNKRCLLAYHRVRTDKLEQMCWNGQDVLDEMGMGQADGSAEAAAASGAPTGEEEVGAGVGAAPSYLQNSLCPEEEEYVRLYGDFLAGYKGQWTDIDLTGSLEPPRDLFVDVRVLRDAGEVQTEYGAITLSKNSQFYVRQSDVESLIAQGYLKKL